jgi:hypothetical protein
MTTVLARKAKSNPQGHARVTMDIQALLADVIGYDSPVIDVTPKPAAGRGPTDGAPTVRRVWASQEP